MQTVVGYSKAHSDIKTAIAHGVSQGATSQVAGGDFKSGLIGGVVSYCNHKTGNFNGIELPYNLSLNNVETELKIEFNTTQNIEEDIDDLPF